MKGSPELGNIHGGKARAEPGNTQKPSLGPNSSDAPSAVLSAARSLTTIVAEANTVEMSSLSRFFNATLGDCMELSPSSKTFRSLREPVEDGFSVVTAEVDDGADKSHRFDPLQLETTNTQNPLFFRGI